MGESHPRMPSSPVAVPDRKTAPAKAKRSGPSEPKRKKKTSLERARRKLDRAYAEVDQSIVEQRRLKWFLLLMVTTWPIGLIWGPWWAAYMATGWFCFWGVGTYLNFFHRRNARLRLEDAKLLFGEAEDPRDEATDDASV